MKPYYQDEWVTIYHGDCRDILPELPKVDLVLTDPPYGVGIDYASYDDALKDTTAMVIDFIKMAVTKSDIVMFTAGKWDTELSLYQKFPPRWRLCWYKGSQSTASAVGFNDWEAVLVYGDKVHRNAHDYFYALPERMGAYGHPCPKPLKFYTTLISRFTKVGETVLDPFLGSGTACRSSLNINRKCIGIEIEEKYCEIAAQRCSQSVMDLR